MARRGGKTTGCRGSGPVLHNVIKKFYNEISVLKFTWLSAFFIMLLVFNKTILNGLPKSLGKSGERGELVARNPVHPTMNVQEKEKKATHRFCCPS